MIPVEFGKKQSGVYFIFEDDGNVAYIGKSRNIDTRFHHASWRFMAPRMKIVLVPADRLASMSELEQELIEHHRPPMNTTYTPRAAEVQRVAWRVRRANNHM